MHHELSVHEKISATPQSKLAPKPISSHLNNLAHSQQQESLIDML